MTSPAEPTATRSTGTGGGPSDRARRMAGAGVSGKAAVAALQAALAAEDAASYGYGVVGAHLSGKDFGLANADCAIHERARDALSTILTTLGATPQPAAVAYRLPVAVSSATDAAKLAVDLELEVIAGYVALVGAGDRKLRKLAATRMQDAAIRAARWGGQPTAFPGLRIS
jgi:uncharacterized protein DUF4439